MRGRILAVLMAAVLGITAMSGCAKEEAQVVVFSIVDENGFALEDVNIFFGGDLQPRASTASDGTATLDMTGIAPDIVMRKEGYTILSVLNRSWSRVRLASYTLERIPNLFVAPKTPVGGELTVTISDGTAGSSVVVYVTKGNETIGTSGVVDNTGSYSHTFTNLIPGIYYASAFPVTAGILDEPFPSEALTMIAVSEDVEVVAGAEEPAAVTAKMASGSKSLLMSVITDLGELPVQVYGNVYRDEEQKQWVADNSTSAVGPTVLDLPFLMPVNTDNLSSSSYELYSQVDDTSLVGFWDYSRITNYKSFNSQFEFDAASDVQDLSLTNFGLSGNIPANDTVSVDTHPVFSAQVTSREVEYTEIRLSKWEFDADGVFLGHYLEHKVQNYTQTETTLPYITGGLALDTVYQYSYILRDSTDSDEKSTHILETARNNICISTGTVIPSVLRVGTCVPITTGGGAVLGNPDLPKIY